MGIKSAFSFRRRRQQNHRDDPARTTVSPPRTSDVANDQNRSGMQPVVSPTYQPSAIKMIGGDAADKGVGISSERAVQPVTERAANGRTGKTSTSEVGEKHVRSLTH